MATVGVVSPGFMGAGLGWALREGGARVVAMVAGRSARTRRFAEEAGLELLPTLPEVIAAADVILSVTPPGRARAAAGEIAAAMTATGNHPIVADLNAIAPTTMTEIAALLSPASVVDGAISGAPPTVRSGARIYLSGKDAEIIAALPWQDRVTRIVVGDQIGRASAVKMSTAGVYKGVNALITQAMRAAAANGVLDEFLADLAHNDLDPTGVVSSATKAHRFIDEMREIATTQSAAGLTPALFTAIAEVYADIATTPLANGDPETSNNAMPPADIVRLLSSSAPGKGETVTPER